MGYIYKITNTLDNKCYIGQTITNIEERWRHHKTNSSNCLYLKNAFKKYGINKFKFEIVCICFDDDLNRFEIEYIKHFNSLVPNGYNLKAGGKCGGKLHQETKEKISKTLTEKYKNGYVHQYKDNKHPWLGRKHTLESKIKISISLTGRKFSYSQIQDMKGRGNKKVLQFDLNGDLINVYKSTKYAAEQNNTTTAGVSMVCNNKRKQLKGYKYTFADNNFESVLNNIRNINICH
jgi:group I intron endonuclease